jgi:hypothetical protein
MHAGFLHRWKREESKGLNVILKCMMKHLKMQNIHMLASLSNLPANYVVSYSHYK